MSKERFSLVTVNKDLTIKREWSVSCTCFKILVLIYLDIWGKHKKGIHKGCSLSSLFFTRSVLRGFTHTTKSFYTVTETCPPLKTKKPLVIYVYWHLKKTKNASKASLTNSGMQTVECCGFYRPVRGGETQSHNCKPEACCDSSWCIRFKWSAPELIGSDMKSCNSLLIISHRCAVWMQHSAAIQVKRCGVNDILVRTEMHVHGWKSSVSVKKLQALSSNESFISSLWEMVWRSWIILDKYSVVVIMLNIRDIQYQIFRPVSVLVLPLKYSLLKSTDATNTLDTWKFN